MIMTGTGAPTGLVNDEPRVVPRRDYVKCIRPRTRTGEDARDEVEEGRRQKTEDARQCTRRLWASPVPLKMTQIPYLKYRKDYPYGDYDHLEYTFSPSTSSEPIASRE